MTRLALDAAPAVDLPRRFLLTTPPWGMLAGALLMAAGPAVVTTRWHPALLAATHAFTLGVFGNLLCGSLLQFLPAAAGVRVRGGRHAARSLHVLLNAGALLLVAALHGASNALFAPASIVLLGAFVLFAAMAAPGLFAARGQRLLRNGLGLALVAATAAATLGAGLALVLAGHVVLPWPLPAMADVHASTGVLGWLLLSIAAVGRVVMPMFQGAAVLPARVLAMWLGGIAIALPLAAVARMTRADDAPLRLVLVVAAITFAFGVLSLQVASPHARNAPLRAGWRAGAIALVAAAVALAAGEGVLAGVLAIAVALPFFAVGMQLEIVAFLGWLDLHRRCARGIRLPPVQRLMPPADKWRVFATFLVAATLLPAAVCWPSPHLVCVAGFAVVVAHALLGWTLWQVRRRGTRFLAGVDA